MLSNCGFWICSPPQDACTYDTINTLGIVKWKQRWIILCINKYVTLWSTYTPIFLSEHNIYPHPVLFERNNCNEACRSSNYCTLMVISLIQRYCNNMTIPNILCQNDKETLRMLQLYSYMKTWTQPFIRAIIPSNSLRSENTRMWCWNVLGLSLDSTQEILTYLISYQAFR